MSRVMRPRTTYIGIPPGYARVRPWVAPLCALVGAVLGFALAGSL